MVIAQSVGIIVASSILAARFLRALASVLESASGVCWVCKDEWPTFCRRCNKRRELPL